MKAYIQEKMIRAVIKISMNKKEVKLNTLRQLRDMVKSDIEKVGPVMDDYDGGQVAAYEKTLNNIAAFEAIVNQVCD